MTINGINISNNSSVWSNLQSAGTSQVSGTDSDGDNDGSVGVVGTGRSKSSGLMQNIMQTLKQLGLNQPGQATDTSAVDNVTAASRAGSKNAIRAFMHSLFQAMNQGANPNTQVSGAPDSDGDTDGSGNASAAKSGYGNTSIKLQNLLQGLASGAAGSTQNSSLNSLNNDFMNLLQSFGDNTGTANSASSAQTTLQTFLQTLVQNLTNQQSTDINNLNTTGITVNAKA